ncbi:DNA polymerase III subunit delta' [Asticcacaulis sp. BYS171W]|uniref:DNA polymerase III subunit delta n=1 Tax=Asticcacaulis aquaticus TaxID=2984212 RepID=A0ABT5HP08_9CAUL|nr:DNA polymerase III subunit delta' [Asticcacaulis aquaticus]MDC7681795.1 DNA polymerase III subunit delta' [Asticcacaulis aquaticus]
MAEDEDHRVSHPRAVFDLINGEPQEHALIDALSRGRLHHAWLLCGPEGVGKATFAYRAARYLMGRDRDRGFGLLGMSPDDADARLIVAQSHPDLLVLEREEKDGKTRKNITVDAVREVGEFFSKAPSRSAYRVCIVDAVDDLNINSANALLKILEEPPERGILFLISHSPGKLLATIRSRCRRLGFSPWDDAMVHRFVESRTELPEETLERLVVMAKGSPGRALRLWEDGALEMDELAAKLLSKAPPSRFELLPLMTLFKTNNSKVDGPKKFTQFITALSERVREQALSADVPARGRMWSELWTRLNAVLPETEGINLDRGEYFWSIVKDIKSIY